MLETGTFPCGVLGHTEIRYGPQINSRCGVGWRCPILCCGVDWRIIDLWCSRRPSPTITKREIPHGRRLFLATVTEVGHHTLINSHDSAMFDLFWIISTHAYFLWISKIDDSNSHNPGVRFIQKCSKSWISHPFLRGWADVRFGGVFGLWTLFVFKFLDSSKTFFQIW